MKILHIIDSLSMGGAENLLIGLAGEQAARGHDVTVAPLICVKNTPVRDKMEAKGVKVKPFAAKGSLYNLFFIFRIAKVLKKYDIVHVHLFPALYWTAFAKLLAFSKVPLVYTEHSTDDRRRGNPIFRIIDKFVYQYCYSYIVACADKALETFKQSYPKISHVGAINNGVDTQICRNAEPYSKRVLLDVGEDVFVVTMVARFMTMKRQDTVVEAISKLPDNIHAVFVGGSENDEGLVRVKNLAVEKEVADRVHFLYIRNDVPRILKTSDVVVMASDFEGLSLSSIEGMAAGKPFIASNVNGLREVVGGAGILFENKDSDNLAKKIGQLASDKEYYENIAKKCLDRSTEFDVHKMVDSYMCVYDKVLK